MGLNLKLIIAHSLSVKPDGRYPIMKIANN